MFLNRYVHHQRSDESGSALVVVVGVMAVGLILTALAMNSVVNGLGFTTATRAGVQSQGGAEAGLAAARAGLFPDATSHLNTCASQPTSGNYASLTSPGPIYDANVEQYDATGWHLGCPTAATTQVRVTSTGTAQARGVAGQSAGDTSKVEAVLKWIPPGTVPSGVGMYLYGGAAVEANSSLDLSESTSAGLMIKNGDLYCNKNGTVINGSVLVNGNLTFADKCSVNGSAWVASSATLGSGLIAHDLTAGSVSPNPPGTHVGGTYTQGGSLPVVPQWTDLAYTPTDWLDSTGSPFEVKPLAGCALPNGTLGGTVLGKPVIMNALACTGGPTVTNNTTVKLTSDVVIFAQQFNWDVNSLVFQSATTAEHRVWFITPDYVADHTPSCQSTLASPNTQGNFTINNGFAIDAKISAFLYTPCAFDGKNGFTWHGQIYSGQYSYVENNPSFTFVPMGVAGADLGTGLSTSPIPYPKPGAVVSIRDLSGP